ncbi:MAG TPA: hypothetical protein VN921_00325 [Chthoniobacterales bacterium]|nr:hypothetical protein [Chthoniobacterales bacterium]
MVGRDAAPRRPRTAQRAVPTRKATPLVWLNLVCLDAPLVALAWLWLFARTFHVALDLGNCAILFLTAWLIYLADRLADALALPGQIPLSRRGEFCLKHRRPWSWTLAAIAIVDAGLIWRTTDSKTFFIGVLVGMAALIYLILNYSLGRIWSFIPVKEAAIGFLFAAGTLVGLLPDFPAVSPTFVLSALAFGFLCTLNCVSIAVWERELDVGQGKISIATRHPSVQRHLGKLALALALASFFGVMFYPGAALIFGCAGASALLLALLDFIGGAIDQDQRTALADLVLLTPLVVLIGASV